MTTVYDVPAQPLIDRIASEMEDEDAVEPPVQYARGFPEL